MDIPSYRILGVRVNPLAIPDLHAVIAQAVSSSQRCIIASQNLHSIYLYHHNAKMRAFGAKVQYMRTDGMPLVFLARLLGYSMQRKHRVTYMDWLHPLMAEAQKQNWRVFYLGSKPGVAERGAEILRSQFPNLDIVTANGYFDTATGSHENKKMLDLIATYQPNVLMVGMGMPRQEHWILDNLESINANAILTCGACIDYIAGEIPIPPRWMGQLGMEWFSRLVSEPRRLWKRYLLGPWFLANLFMRDLLVQRLQAK